MILAGVLLKPDKLVRTMFPYINKHGNNTVMFGFIIKDVYIIFLFVIMLINIYFTMAIFFAHVLIVRSETYNPFGGFDCFDENGEEINSTTIEEAFELRKSNRTIECYAWQLNIAGAVGQATGTLLFSGSGCTSSVLLYFRRSIIAYAYIELLFITPFTNQVTSVEGFISVVVRQSIRY